MNYFKNTKPFLLFSICLLTINLVKGQDIYYAGVEDMKLWYNPALKTNKTSFLHAHVKSVNYPGIAAYSSKGAMIELPLSGHHKTVDNIGFADLAVGLNADNSSNGTMKISTVMLAFSYALPLDYDNTYLAAGLQGGYTFNQVGTYRI